MVHMLYQWRLGKFSAPGKRVLHLSSNVCDAYAREGRREGLVSQVLWDEDGLHLQAEMRHTRVYMTMGIGDDDWTWWNRVRE